MFRFVFILGLFTFGTSVAAQDTSLCGKIKSGTLSIPSYKFIVASKEGRPIPNLKVEGRLLITEHKWAHTYQDWNWEQINHYTAIPLRFDSAIGMWISEAVPNIPVPTRKHTWILKPKCLDRIEEVRFDFRVGEKFTPEEGYGGLFVVPIRNRKIGEFQLPDPSQPIKITMKNWYGDKTF